MTIDVRMKASDLLACGADWKLYNYITTKTECATSLAAKLI
jgi:hypothetical protein